MPPPSPPLANLPHLGHDHFEILRQCFSNSFHLGTRAGRPRLGGHVRPRSHRCPSVMRAALPACMMTAAGTRTRAPSERYAPVYPHTASVVPPLDTCMHAGHHLAVLACGPR